MTVAVDFLDGDQQLLIAAPTWTGRASTGGVVAALGDLQGLAKFADVVGVPHGVDQVMPLCGVKQQFFCKSQIGWCDWLRVVLVI